MPGADRLREIQDKVRELGATCVFAEPQFEPKLISVVTEGTDARGSQLDPLGASIDAGSGALFRVLRGMATSFKGLPVRRVVTLRQFPEVTPKIAIDVYQGALVNKTLQGFFCRRGRPAGEGREVEWPMQSPRKTSRSANTGSAAFSPCRTTPQVS
jgi:hypothetical protein